MTVHAGGELMLVKLIGGANDMTTELFFVVTCKARGRA